MLNCRLVVDVGIDFDSLNFAPFRLPYIRAQLETYCILFELEQNIQRFFSATASDLSDI